MNIDPKKLMIIDEFTKMAKGKNSDEILPLMLAISNKLKQAGISFSKEESLYLIEQLKSGMNSSEKEKIDTLVKLIM